MAGKLLCCSVLLPAGPRQQNSESVRRTSTNEEWESIHPLAKGHSGSLAVALLVLVYSPGAAQGVRTDLLPPLGTEVRAILSSRAEVERAQGILVEAGNQGLVLEADRGRHIYRIPAEVLLGLEISLGRNHGRGAFQGLGLGLLGGAILWGGLMALSANQDANCIYFCSAGSNFLVGAAVGGVIGGGLGLVFGAAIGTHEWRRAW